MSVSFLKQYEELIKKIEVTRNENITHDELGAQDGFHEAEKAKNQLCDYIVSILENAFQIHEKLNEAILQKSIRIIITSLKETAGLMIKINEISSEERRCHSEYPAERKNVIHEIKKKELHLKEFLHPLELEIRVKKDSGKEPVAWDVIENDRKRIKKLAAEAEKAVSGLRDKVIDEGVKTSSTHFDDLSTHHEGLENSWFNVFVVFSSITAAAAVYAVLWPIDEIGSIESLVTIIRRVLLVMIPVAFMKISLSKYNVERNLRIIYTHRQAVIRQYELFEVGIGDDNPQQKNELRLQVAKYIFTDPVTGYLGKDVDSKDININPVVAAGEKFITKT